MNIIYGNDNNRNLLVASGGVTAILSIMKTYEQEEGVISAACGALANLGYGSGEKRSRRKAGQCHASLQRPLPETTRGLIAKEGGIVLVLHVLKRYIRSRRVVSKGLWMLLVMSSDGTAELALAAMHCLLSQHLPLSPLRDGHTCTAETNAIEIAMSGGISVIVNSIRASVMDPTVARFGCWALANVVWSSSEFNAVILPHQQLGINATAPAPSFTMSGEIQERAIIDGAVSACHEAIRGHPGNESIQ